MINGSFKSMEKSFENKLNETISTFHKINI